MPPKKAGNDDGGGKEKAGKKMTEEEAEPLILEYLIKQNRPYNAIDLQANLRSKHNISKPAVVKMLAVLAQNGKIVEKVYGKQAIYAAKQPDQDVPANDLTNLRAETAQLKVKLAELNTAHKATQADIMALESAPSTNDLPHRITSLQADLDRQKSHLSALRENTTMMLSTADITSIDTEFAKVKKIWGHLRKSAKTAADQICDATGNPTDWLEEELGWEEDPPSLLELLKHPVPVRQAKRKC